jgi:hypothetical protein
MTPATTSSTRWFGVHVLMQKGKHDAQALTGVVPALRKVGINVLIAEINYNYAFASHPEMCADKTSKKADIRALVQACRAEGMRLIPQFQCIGHQSWAKQTFPLLTHYPQFDETPGQFANNEGIYCRSWCPRHPGVNPLIFDLLEELLEAFSADALHVGLDEIFLIGSEHCPRCQGGNTGEILADAINAYHDLLVKKHGVEMLMWGDRLLDDREMHYGEWESARNGTHTAVDLIPKDIIQCDWHYEKGAYPSVAWFVEKGFRVLPGGWRVVENTEALIKAEQAVNNERMLGHLCTTWGAVQMNKLAEWPPILKTAELLKSG